MKAMQLELQKIECEFFFQDVIKLQNKNSNSNIIVTFIEENDLPELLYVNSTSFRNIIQSLVQLASTISNARHIIVSTSYYGSVLRIELKFKFTKSAMHINQNWLQDFRKNNIQFINLSNLISELGSQLILSIKDDMSGYFRFYIKNNYIS